jgi:hypothetical protein
MVRPQMNGHTIPWNQNDGLEPRFDLFSEKGLKQI